MTDTDTRLSHAKAIAADAGKMASVFFQDIAALELKSKGARDIVSNADLEVETFVREQIAVAFPDDGIVGEENERTPSRSGWTWVIDPIDGTVNFVNGIPQWCVILACVYDDETKIGVILEPTTGEMFWAAKGQGAFVNDTELSVAKTEGLHDGSVGVGMSERTAPGMAADLVARILDEGGVFFRNASGGLMLSYVAAGRLIGYCEGHMNAWDCLAGQLLVAEAGGKIEQQSATQMLESGGRVIVSTPVVFDQLLAMSLDVFQR